MPAISSAGRAANIDMSMTDSPSPAQRRSMMPERSRIHSSEESIRSTISELGTIRRGR